MSERTFIVTRETETVREADLGCFVMELDRGGAPQRYGRSVDEARRMNEVEAYRAAYLATLEGEDMVRVHEEVNPEPYWRAIQ